MALTETQLDHISGVLRGLGLAGDPLRPMRLRNLSHEHVQVAEFGVLRMPIALPSELHWTAWADFQAEAYTTLSRLGLAPRFLAALESSQALPNGGALIDLVKGRLPALPVDFRRLARFLADMHQMPVPMPEMRGLPSFEDPLQRVAQLISDQGRYVKDAPVSEAVRAALEDELGWLADFTKSGWVRRGSPPFGLSRGRIHPGDFLIDQEGDVMLIDVENCHYGLPTLDVGALSIYPATVWDMSLQAELSEDDVLNFHIDYLEALDPRLRAQSQPWLAPARRIATLRVLTWCCMWLVRHRRPGDQWAADRRPPGIIAHQRGLCQHLTSDNVVHALQSEWQDQQGLCARIDAL